MPQQQEIVSEYGPASNIQIENWINFLYNRLTHSAVLKLHRQRISRKGLKQT